MKNEISYTHWSSNYIIIEKNLKCIKDKRLCD